MTERGSQFQPSGRAGDVHAGDHRKHAPRPPFREAELDGLAGRLGISTEQTIPDRHVAEIARVDVALVVVDVLLGPLDQQSGPTRGAYVPMLVERDREAEYAGQS